MYAANTPQQGTILPLSRRAVEHLLFTTESKIETSREASLPTGDRRWHFPQTQWSDGGDMDSEQRGSAFACRSLRQR